MRENGRIRCQSHMILTRDSTRLNSGSPVDRLRKLAVVRQRCDLPLAQEPLKLSKLQVFQANIMAPSLAYSNPVCFHQKQLSFVMAYLRMR